MPATRLADLLFTFVIGKALRAIQCKLVCAGLCDTLPVSTCVFSPSSSSGVVHDLGASYVDDKAFL